MNSDDGKTNEQLINELKELRSFQSYLIENANDGIVILQDNLLKWANNKLLLMAGIPEEKAVGRPFAEFVDGNYRELVVNRYRKRLDGEVPPSIYEIELLSSYMITWDMILQGH